MTSIRVNNLANFDQDEMDTITSYLVGDKEDVDIEYNFWQGDDDGSIDDIHDTWEASSDNTMIMVDRPGLEDQTYIIADGRCWKQEWFQTAVLAFYGWTYTDAWGESDDAAQVMANACVAWVRADATGKVDIVDFWTSLQADDDVTLADYVDVDEINFAYTGDSDSIVQQLTDLGITDRDADGEQEEEENEEGTV